MTTKVPYGTRRPYHGPQAPTITNHPGPQDAVRGCTTREFRAQPGVAARLRYPRRPRISAAGRKSAAARTSRSETGVGSVTGTLPGTAWSPTAGAGGCTAKDAIGPR